MKEHKLLIAVVILIAVLSAIWGMLIVNTSDYASAEESDVFTVHADFKDNYIRTYILEDTINDQEYIVVRGYSGGVAITPRLGVSNE